MGLFDVKELWLRAIVQGSEPRAGSTLAAPPAPRTQKTRSRLAWLTACALSALALAAAYQLLCVFQPAAFLNQHLIVMDDAYYYFQVARNLATRGTATFDGIHDTSGVQLLWGALVSAIGVLVPGRIELLRATLLLSLGLNVAAGIMLWRLGRRLYSDEVGTLATLLWSGFMVALSPTMLGMEYALHIVVIIATIAAWWRVLTAPGSVTAARLLGLGALLALNFWTRLDAAVISLLIWLSVTVALLGHRRSAMAYSGWMMALSVVPIVGAVGYLAACHLLAGTFVPISGLAKAHYAAQHFKDYDWLTSLAGHVLWIVRIHCRAMVDIVASALLTGPLFRPVPVMTVAIVLLATLWGAHRIYRCRAADPGRFRVATFLGLLWLFAAVHVAVIVATIGHFSHVTQHYYGWLLVTWCLWAAVLIDTGFASVRSPRARRLLVAGGLIGFAAIHGWAAARNFALDAKPNFNARRVAMVAWINDNIPPDARIGAWNAGMLGYFVTPTVVNLDGLVNDKAFLEQLRSGASTLEYLRREGITYLIDVNSPDLSMPYRASWDRSLWFRNSIQWTHLHTVYVEPGQEDPIFIVQLRDPLESVRRP